jgi:dTMP kinase
MPPSPTREEGAASTWEKLQSLCDWVLGDLQPDLTLIFDAPVEIAQKRLHAATPIPTDFEQEQAAFFERCALPTCALRPKIPQRVRLIDATKPR